MSSLDCISNGTLGELMMNDEGASEHYRAGLTLDKTSLKFLGPECFSNTFSFDAIFEQQDPQDRIFYDVESIVLSVLQGFNGTICAYGQTGSGKTHTLFGDIGSSSTRGIVPRAMAAVCTGMASNTEDCIFSVGMSVVEIYCEKIRDLLDTSNENLQVQQDRVRGVYLANAHEAAVWSEAQLINRSLSALGNVVNALTDGKATHVPYRDSKLTRVLQDSLGGTAKTALIICCSPCMSNASETLSSLRFGARAQGITNAVQSNACSIAGKDIANLLVAARKDCDDLRSQLILLEWRKFTTSLF
ncbi:hypothetical protein WJX84_012466 [Apatococcus fuscideae]|uniref:Kinesin motor domain-containing protein n=1 Tax=Apatococcus fuscideae TaxID=2026836 RepID=A0AAW1TJ23_9CHLO